VPVALLTSRPSGILDAGLGEGDLPGLPDDGPAHGKLLAGGGPARIVSVLSSIVALLCGRGGKASVDGEVHRRVEHDSVHAGLHSPFTRDAGV